MAKQQQQRQLKIGMWTAIRDIANHSINKGQFPFFIVGLIVIYMIYRMPSEEVSKLVFRILEKVVDFSIVGYILAGFTAIGWSVHAKLQRRNITNGMRRLSNERNKWQETALGKKPPSSEE